MLTDAIFLGLAFTAGWFARAHFGTYAEMRDWVKSKYREIKG